MKSFATPITIVAALAAATMSLTACGKDADHD